MALNYLFGDIGGGEVLFLTNHHITNMPPIILVLLLSTIKQNMGT